MNKRYITALMVLSLAAGSGGCGLVDVVDVEPVGQVFDEKAITSIKKAQVALYGTYGLLKDGLELLDNQPGIAASMGLTMKAGPSGSDVYFQNNVPTEDYNIGSIYQKYYEVLNNANHIIRKTALLETSDPRKEEIIAEARFLRAFSHFNLLRLFGQFFNMESRYGIVVKPAPITEVEPVPRNTVKEAYGLVLEDLDYAIAHAPEFGSTFYASKLAAQALKARVLLYAKRYKEAADAATLVINSGKVSLEASYADIFKKKIVGTKEVIFQLPFDDKQDRNNKAYIFRSSFVPSDYYIELMKTDNRDSVAITTTAAGVIRNNKFNGSSFNGQTLTADTEYFLRLDEIYLILAEAQVRAGNTEAGREALNVIRRRVKMPEITVTGTPALLEAIRMEKILELGAESGEEWFDLVRYAVEGNLKVSDYKPGVVNETRYILPLPFETVRLSNGVLEQNPGY